MEPIIQDLLSQDLRFDMGMIFDSILRLMLKKIGGEKSIKNI
jgi:hypothetical protein